MCFYNITHLRSEMLAHKHAVLEEKLIKPIIKQKR